MNSKDDVLAKSAFVFKFRNDFSLNLIYSTHLRYSSFFLDLSSVRIFSYFVSVCYTISQTILREPISTLPSYGGGGGRRWGGGGYLARSTPREVYLALHNAQF